MTKFAIIPIIVVDTRSRYASICPRQIATANFKSSFRLIQLIYLAAAPKYEIHWFVLAIAYGL